jgi:hypothetical protein
MRNRSPFLPLWLLLCPLAMRAQEIVTQLPDAPQLQAQAQQTTPASNSATTNSPSSLPPDSTRRNAYASTGGAVGAEKQPTNQCRGAARPGTKAGRPRDSLGVASVAEWQCDCSRR